MTTEPKRIPLEDCVDGGFYRISAHHFQFGVFVARSKGFIGLREKFRVWNLDIEYHWDTGEPCGTALPQEYLEQCPLEDLKTGHSVEEKGRVVYRMNKPLFRWLKKKSQQYR